MTRKTITFKLLSFIAIAFTIMTVCVLLLGHGRLTDIIDGSQGALYKDRLDAILNMLDNKHLRLESTGMVEVYEESFKDAILRDLRRLYYKSEHQRVHPFIIGSDGGIVMHPELPRGSDALVDAEHVKRMVKLKNGNFNYICKTGEKKWCTFTYFGKWRWVVGYAVPLEIKYADSHELLRSLTLIMTLIALLVLLALSTIIARFTRPIIALTRVSEEMAAGRLDSPIDATRGDEVGVLARGFVRMRDSIREKISALAESNQELVREMDRRARMENALKQSERRFRSVVENSPMGMLMYGLAGGDRLVLEDSNPAADHHTGLENAERMGAVLEEAHPILVGTDAPERFRLAASRGEYWSEELIFQKEGEVRYAFEVHAFQTLPGQMAVMFSNITDRVRDAEEMARLRNLLDNIVNSMPSVLVGVDGRGRVTQWNLEAEERTGVAANKALGRVLSEVYPRFAGEMDAISRSMAGRETCKELKIAERVDGETRYSDVTVYPLITNGVDGAVIRVDDVTERVRIEEMMIQSEKMLSVGGLAAGMAHEINNPLAGILQNLQVMRLRVSGDLPKNRRTARECGASMEALAAYIEKRGLLKMMDSIMDSGKRAAQIVENMLSFSRKSESHFAPCDLGDLLDKTLTLAENDYDLKKKFDFRQVEIVREYASDLPKVPCEASKLQQVFLNILKNGAQAMAEAGGEARSRFTLRVHPVDDMVQVEIEDNGPGMEEAVQKRIFEPFFTTKPVGVGTGLGLSVSYFIISENHQGEMTAASEPGAGATFTMRLPISRSAESG